MLSRLQSISQYAFSCAMVTDFIDRIRLALKRDGVTPGGLARKAGLHRNTLYGVERDDWNPSATVLKALEPHIVAIEAGDWQAEAPAEAA
jgi:transcriptional regulator with XRE-family HTH domain